MADRPTSANDPGDQAATGWTDADPVLIGDGDGAGGRPMSARAKALIGLATAVVTGVTGVLIANPGLLHPDSGNGSGAGGRSQINNVIHNNNVIGSTSATPTPTPVVSATPCAEPTTTVHGLSAAFISPCDGDARPQSSPSVTLAVPAYPARDGSQGSIWLTERILTDGHDMTLDQPPMYAVSRVESGTARPLGHHTWGITPVVYGGCDEHGPVEFDVYWLPPAAAKKVLVAWKENTPISLPAGNKLLAHVGVQITASC